MGLVENTCLVCQFEFEPFTVVWDYRYDSVMFVVEARRDWA